MPIDTSLVGTNTAEIMEHLGDLYEDVEAEVIEVMTIVAVRSDQKPGPDWEEIESTDPEDGYGYVHYRSSEAKWYRQLGLLEAAKMAIRS